MIFGGLRSSLFALRIRFRYSSCTFFGYVGRPILCAGASPRCFFLCLGSTRVSGFYAQVRVPGVLFSNPDFCRNAMAVTNAIELAFFYILGGTFTLIVYRYLRREFVFGTLLAPFLGMLEGQFCAQARLLGVFSFVWGPRG